MHARRGFLLLVVIIALVAGVAGAQAQEPVTLLVWDQWGEDPEAVYMDELIAAFEEANPNIDIVQESFIFQDMHEILRTALASGTGPDVFYYGGGAGWLGPLVDAGLVMPLTEAYEEQGWNDLIFEWTKRDSTMNGEVYGIGNELEFIGAYYNMDIFEEVGLEVPESYDELLASCATLQDAGYIPIAFADQAGWPAYHMFSIMTNNLLGKEGIEEALFGEGRWDDPLVVEGIRKFFVEMNEAGCFIPNATAASYYSGTEPIQLGAEWHHNRPTLISSMPVWGMPHRHYPLWDLARIEQTCIRLLEGGRIITEPMIGRRFRYDQAPEAYRMIDQHPEESIKTLFDYSG